MPAGRGGAAGEQQAQPRGVLVMAARGRGLVAACADGAMYVLEPPDGRLRCGRGLRVTAPCGAGGGGRLAVRQSPPQTRLTSCSPSCGVSEPMAGWGKPSSVEQTQALARFPHAPRSRGGSAGDAPLVVSRRWAFAAGGCPAVAALSVSIADDQVAVAAGGGRLLLLDINAAEDAAAASQEGGGAVAGSDEGGGAARAGPAAGIGVGEASGGGSGGGTSAAGIFTDAGAEVSAWPRPCPLPGALLGPTSALAECSHAQPAARSRRPCTMLPQAVLRPLACPTPQDRVPAGSPFRALLGAPSLPGRIAAVSAAAHAPLLLAACGEPRAVAVWDWARRRCLARRALWDEPLAAALSPGGGVALVGTTEKLLAFHVLRVGCRVLAHGARA